MRRALRKSRLLIFFAIMGPGIITAFADNDAGGITTYSVAGARYGYQLLWMLFLVTFSLAVTQEMAARMGAVTGKGLAALIREQFGLRPTAFCMLALLVANLATTASNFAGMAASLEIFGLSKYLAVPLMALVVWLLVARGSYKGVEKVFLFLCLAYFSYVITGFMVDVDWPQVARSTFVPSMRFDFDFVLLSIALIGTTVTPWMQFYIQSSVVEKGVGLEKYGYQRMDVLVGSLFTDFIAFFIIVVTAATLFVSGIEINSARDAALALRPLAGRYAELLFVLGLFNASTLAACILSLSTSYAICEAFGWEAGVDKSFDDAPLFISIYTFSILLGALIVLIPKISLISVMLISQDVNGILLPIILIFMLLIVNDTSVMGKYTNKPWFNVVAWATAIFVIALTIALIVLSLIPLFR
jgi:NRAMP (natural resistance-associated macrophage protein)-like metal ion transporter